MSDESDEKKTPPGRSHVEIPIPTEHLLTSLLHPHKDSKRQSFIDDELEIKEIIVIEIEEHRSLHLLDQEDKEIYERIKNWMKENPEASLLDTVNQFSSEPNGDAIAKILHNFQFPDYVLKFTREEHEKRSVEKQIKRRNFERLLLRAGLVIEVENDAVNSEDFFVKIYAPFQKLCEQAQQIKLNMRLDVRDSVDIDIKPKKKSSLYSSISKHFTYKINFEKQAAFFRVSKLRQFEGAEPEKSMGEIMLNFFSMSRRNLLVHRILMTANQINTTHTEPNEAPVMVKKKIASLALKRLKNEKVYTQYYPLHDGPPRVTENTPLSEMNTRAYLYETWVKSRGAQPLERIRRYFGEKLAIYFAWLGFYTTWLILASVGGVIVVFYGLIVAVRTGSFDDGLNGISVIWDNALTVPFAFFMAVWATLFLETWKRTCSTIQYDWDVVDVIKEELPRPEFYGTALRTSPITLKQEIYFPYRFRLQKLVISSFVVLISLGIVIVSIGVLIIFPKIWFQIGVLTSLVTALVNLVTIMILSMLYKNIAVWLTNFENHKTPTQHEDSLILKTYLFDFLNFYTALFYIMLFKQGYIRMIINDPDLTTGCEYDNCLIELTIQLATILIGRQTIGQFQEIFLPWIRGKLNKEEIKEELNALKAIYEKSGRPNKEVPQWAHDERLPPVKGAIRSEYEEMVVQFGFISLFSPAFPLAALFALLNNFLEIRSDAFKYVVTLQRPVGYQAQSIGMWEQIMGMISILAVLTNAIIIAFHSTWMQNQFQNFTGDDEDQLFVARLLFILIFEHIIFLIKLAFASLIPNTPKSVRVAIQREKYLVRLTLEDEAPALDEYMADEDDSSLFDRNGELKLPKRKDEQEAANDKSKSSVGDDGGVVIE